MNRQKDKEQDGVLLKEINRLIVKDAMRDGYLIKMPSNLSKPILAKVREAVRGAGLTPEEIKSFAPDVDQDLRGAQTEWDMDGLLQAQTQAILKALGGE